MKNSPDLIHKYSVPMEFLKERTFSFGVICEHLQDIYQYNPEIKPFLNDNYLSESCRINIDLVEMKKPHLEYNPPSWERFQKYHQPYRFVASVPPIVFINHPQLVKDFLHGKIYIMYSLHDHGDEVYIFTDMMNFSERVAEILH